MKARVNIHLTNLDAVMKEKDKVSKKVSELCAALTDLDRALFDIGIEISQPPAGTDD